MKYEHWNSVSEHCIGTCNQVWLSLPWSYRSSKYVVCNLCGRRRNGDCGAQCHKGFEG